MFIPLLLSLYQDWQGMVIIKNQFLFYQVWLCFFRLGTRWLHTTNQSPNRDGFRGGYFSNLQFGKASLCQTQTVGIPDSDLF